MRAKLRYWQVAGALLLPPALFSVYLVLSRTPTRWFTTESDWAALILSVGVGVVTGWRLEAPKTLKLLAATLYTAVMLAGCLLYAFAFVCGVFGDCL